MTVIQTNTRPLVALLGRPNVGKSTLFNRLIKGRRALTHDRPGVTRDRMYGEVRREGFSFRIVDTGGVNIDDANAPDHGPQESRGFEKEIYDQARLAIDEALVLVLVVDGREGCTPVDERLARFLRQSDKPVLLVVNKIDGPEQEDVLLSDFYGLGLDIATVSAAHGYNLSGLVHRIAELLPEEDSPDQEPEIDEPEQELADEIPDIEDQEDPEYPDAPDLEPLEDSEEPEEPEDKASAYRRPELGLRLAMLGRPNAGKSSLVNALTRQERMIVSEIAGTTRDSVDVTIEFPVKGEPKRYTFVDTAGVRRRTRITDSLERFSVQAAMQSGKKADVAFFVMDATEGVTQQDKKLISYLDREKIPFITLINKMDLVPQDKRKGLQLDFEEALRICPHVPVKYVSAKTRAGLKGLLPLAEEIWRESGLRVSTGVLNRIIAEATQRHQPPVVKRRRAKFYYLTQVGVRPPTFVFFVNDPERVLASYARYLENQLRKLLGVKYAPMAVHFRSRSDKSK